MGKDDLLEFIEGTVFLLKKTIFRVHIVFFSIILRLFARK